MWCVSVDHIPLWAIAVGKFPPQTKVAIRPVIIENTVQLLGLGLSQNMLRISGMPQGAIYKFYAVFVEAAFLPSDYVGQMAATLSLSHFVNKIIIKLHAHAQYSSWWT